MKKMRNAKVLEFPESKSVRKRLQDKAQEQKSVLILSIASVLIMTVFLNQWVSQGTNGSISGNGNREVASVNSLAMARDLKWEHDLAKRMAADKAGFNARIAEDLTSRDELIFGYLAGHYGMKVSDGRIQKLEFIDAQAGDTPMSISNKDHFLVKFSEALGRDFSEVRLTQDSAQEQVYSLISSNKEIVGEARFKLDHNGGVQAIHFTE